MVQLPIVDGAGVGVQELVMLPHVPSLLHCLYMLPSWDAGQPLTDNAPTLVSGHGGSEGQGGTGAEHPGFVVLKEVVPPRPIGLHVSGVVHAVHVVNAQLLVFETYL